MELLQNITELKELKNEIAEANEAFLTVREYKWPIYESAKRQKADKKAIREYNNSQNGQRALFKEKWDAKLLELQERENRLKAENPKYKKKFKYQLEAEIREFFKPKIAFSVDMAKFKQEPRILYFDIFGEPVYNLVGKESGAEANHREFLKKNREACEQQRQEATRKEAQEKAEYWKKEVEKRKKEAEKARKTTITKEAEAKIETLGDGSYMWNGEDWENMLYPLGYMVEHRKYDSKIYKAEHVGKWQDKETGKVYLGVSVRIKNKEKALELAKKSTHNYPTGEKVIWDCKNKCEIRLQEN